MIDFFKFRKLSEEHGAGDTGTDSLVSKYKSGTPGQNSSAPTRQPARKGDKLNAKMDYSSKIKADDITVKNTMKEDSEQIDELSSDLLSRYKKKAGDSARESDASAAEKFRSGDVKGGKADTDRANKRFSGVMKATKKQFNKEAFEDPEAQKSEMAMTKLHFVKYAAQEIMDYIEMGAPIEEWYQIKLAKVHADMEGLHSYMEGEKRRTGMVMGESTTDLDEAKKKMKDDDPCWKGYEMVGMKKKNGKEVPNCVPKESVDEAKKKMKGEDPCWKGYEMIGMKKGRGGKEVPNCVPKESVEEDYEDLEEMAGANMSTRELHAYLKKKGWNHVRSSGSHDVYKHPNSTENIAVPKHKKIKPPTILGILKQAKKVDKVSVDEGKSSSGYELYHKDFSGAMQHAYDYAKKKYGITIDPDEIDRNVAMGPRKPSAGKTNSYRLKGDKGAVQVQVANLDNKRYELNMYKESLDPSMGAGEYVKDFQKSDAPQFKGKSKKERQKMAVAAYLDAKRGN